MEKEEYHDERPRLGRTGMGMAGEVDWGGVNENGWDVCGRGEVEVQEEETRRDETRRDDWCNSHGCQRTFSRLYWPHVCSLFSSYSRQHPTPVVLVLAVPSTSLGFGFSHSRYPNSNETPDARDGP